MKRIASALAVTLFLSGCASVQKKTTGLQPGMTLFEATYVAGLPTTVTSGLDELFVRFGNEVWVVRNGFLSHVVTDTYASKVDAIKAKDTTARTYFVKLTPAQSNDLYSQSYAEMVGRALTIKGFQVVDSESKANVLVTFDFKVNEKESVKSETEMVPVTSYSSGMASNNWYGLNIFSAQKFSSTTTTTEVPVVKTSTVISYDRGLELKGTEAKSGRQLFVITVQSRGQSSDKRGLFAAMTTAARPLLGKDAGQQLEFPVATNDPIIHHLKTGEQNGLYLTKAVQWKGKFVDVCAPNVPRGATRNSPLTLAIKLGQPEIVDGLIGCGVSPSSQTLDGIPALAIAADAGMKEVFARLLQKGANPNATVGFGKSTSTGQTMELVEYLSSEKFKDYKSMVLEARKKRMPAKESKLGKN